METNLILAGVGGQGILSISYVLDLAALKQGQFLLQAELHGMSQRGGSVQAHVRISDHPLHSALVPKGRGTLVLALDPLECLRYIDYLAPEGLIVSNADPYINILEYPDLERLLDELKSLPHCLVIHAQQLARQAGSGRAQNMVLLGAASPFLGLEPEVIAASIGEAFAQKGEKMQKINLAAFRAGQAIGQTYVSGRAQ